MKRKRDQRRCRGAAGKIPALIFCAAAVLCIVIWVMRHAQMQEGNEPDVVASRCENNVYDLTVAANCDEIKDAEAFAEKVVQKYEENSFRTTKFSVDLGEDIDLVRFHVYLRREEIGGKRRIVSDSLSRRRYNTGRNQRKEVKSYYEFKQDVSAEQIAGQDL